MPGQLDMESRTKTYTDIKNTEAYLQKLESWTRGKEEAFPANVKGDRILVLNPELFTYNLFGARIKCRDRKFKEKVMEVTGILDNATMTLNGHLKGCCDLLVIDEARNKLLISPEDIIKGDNMAYLFLPHPEKLEEFKRLISQFSRHCRKLNNLLEKYYNE
jgi:hypothetical protein